MKELRGKGNEILRWAAPGAIVFWQLYPDLSFNSQMQTARDIPGSQPGWLQTVLIGRRPRTTLIRILVLVTVCFITFKFILLGVRVDGISMEPTYHDHRVNWVNRLAFRGHEPRRGDVVAIRFSDPGPFGIPSELLMKRIVGLPGETVGFQDGHAYINGVILDEPYVKFSCDWDHPPVQCGPDEYYVVGDNRSMPFENHVQGRVRREHIIGKVVFR
jgi:signal peptidase I